MGSQLCQIATDSNRKTSVLANWSLNPPFTWTICFGTNVCKATLTNLGIGQKAWISAKISAYIVIFTDYWPNITLGKISVSVASMSIQIYRYRYLQKYRPGTKTILLGHLSCVLSTQTFKYSLMVPEAASVWTFGWQKI